MSTAEQSAATTRDPRWTATPEGAPFWEAASRGVLVLPTCMQCGRKHWYPRAFCPFCAAQQIDWVESEGTGTIYSYCVNHTGDTPKVLAYVQLDAAGPTLLTAVVDVDPAVLRVGLSVRAVFRPGDAFSMPVFQLRTSE